MFCLRCFLLFVICFLIMKISIIIPLYNDLQHGYIQKMLRAYCDIPDVEVIIVDGGGADAAELIEVVEKYPVQFFSLAQSNRAQRLNKGIEEASGEYILLHHPRSLITKEAIIQLRDGLKSFIWGALRHSFDEESVGLQFTSWYSNWGRGRVKGMYYLDHCIFVKKEVLEHIGGVPEVDIFEDTLLSIQLRKKAWPVLLKQYSVTSAIRFRRNGFWRQALLNQWMKVGFWFRLSPEQLNAWYEKGLWFNNNCYEKTKKK